MEAEEFRTYSPSPPDVMQAGKTLMTDDDYSKRRSPQQLFKIIKDLLKSHYQGVEEEFCRLDEMNTGRLSQEMMFQLLKK